MGLKQIGGQYIAIHSWSITFTLNPLFIFQKVSHLKIHKIIKLNTCEMNNTKHRIELIMDGVCVMGMGVGGGVGEIW